MRGLKYTWYCSFFFWCGSSKRLDSSRKLQNNWKWRTLISYIEIINKNETLQIWYLKLLYTTTHAFSRLKQSGIQYVVNLFTKLNNFYIMTRIFWYQICYYYFFFRMRAKILSLWLVFLCPIRNTCYTICCDWKVRQLSRWNPWHIIKNDFVISSVQDEVI